MAKAAKDKKNSKESSRYLTEIKELPPIQEEEKKENVDRMQSVKIEEIDKGLDKSVEKTNNVPIEPEESRAGEDKEVVGEQKIKQSKLPLSPRDIILGVINLVSLVLLIIIFFKLPDKAKELNNLRTESIKNESSVSFEFGEVEASKEKAEKLKDLFLDDSGVVDFIDEVEKLRNQGTTIKKITFASKEVVKDKTGNYGTPVIIEMSGTWEEIGETLQDIGELPYIFRPVNINVQESEEEAVVSLTYGGFLYVDSRLGQN